MEGAEEEGSEAEGGNGGDGFKVGVWVDFEGLAGEAEGGEYGVA